MCNGCGRPQPATPGHCVACGAVLPDAPRPAPAAPPPPFLDVDLGGGRHLSGVDGRLSFRPGITPAIVVELGNVQDVALKHRPLYEALVGAVLLALVLYRFPVLRPLALIPVPLLGLAIAATWRHYALALVLSGAPPARWGLGLVRRGSAREERVQGAFTRLKEVLRAKAPRQDLPHARA